MKKPKVVVLCGGYGTRIRDVADNIPKAMIPIGNHPVLWHIMKYYSHWGYRTFVLCLGHQGEVIKDFFLNYESHAWDFTLRLGAHRSIVYHKDRSPADWEVTCAETGLHAMTGARVRRAYKYLRGEKHFMLTYGDGVGDIDLDKLMKFHMAHGKIITVTGVRPPGRFGELMSNGRHVVTEFNEKPQATGGRISGGFFVCRREIFNYLSDREDLVFEREPLRNLVADRQMMVYEHDGFWQCMDTYRDYQLLNQLYEKGNAPWVQWK